MGMLDYVLFYIDMGILLVALCMTIKGIKELKSKKLKTKPRKGEIKC